MNERVLVGVKERGDGPFDNSCTRNMMSVITFIPQSLPDILLSPLISYNR